VQRRKGYRYSADALLLADFVTCDHRKVVCDLGTGSGVIPLILAKRKAALKIVGIEIQPELAALTRRNVELNGLEKAVEIMELDLRKVDERFPCRGFDYVLSNPPYRDPKSGKITPNAEKAVARHEITCTMGDVLDAMKYLLKPSGRGAGACIYPAERFPELVENAKMRRLEPKRIQLVHPSREESAELVMVEFVKEGNPGVDILPPIFTAQSV